MTVNNSTSEFGSIIVVIGGLKACTEVFPGKMKKKNVVDVKSIN